MTTLVASLVDAAVVLAIAMAAAVLLRRRSAALRHGILATAIIAASAMPALELLLPHLPVIPWGTPAAVVSSGTTLASDAVSSSATDETEPAGAGAPWSTLLLVVWGTGAAVICGGLVAGLVKLGRLRSQSTPVAGRWRELTDGIATELGIRRPVAVLESDAPSLLVTCGLISPSIILPAGATSWNEARMRIVLRHELAHVKRRDALVQMAGELLRVVQWINPIVWIACRRLRQESEYACDDAVLSEGVDAADYAAELLGVARDLTGRRTTWIAAPAIAHPSTLERRIVAMLHRNRIRTPLGRRGWTAVAIAALAVSIPLAAAGVAPLEEVVPPAAGVATLQSQPPGRPGDIDARRPGDSNVNPAPAPRRAPAERVAAEPVRQAAVAGQVLDQSGGVLPGVDIALTGPQGQLTTHTDAAGRFAFRDLQPGQYEMTASIAGFATFRGALTIAPGQAVQRTITLKLGTVQETITLVCAGPAAASHDRSLVSALLSRAGRLLQSIDSGLFPVLSAQERSTPIRVGGSIRPPRKIKDVKPVCPSAVPAGETTVRLTGQVGLDGLINDLTPAQTSTGVAPPAELVDAALEAVRQWVFTPTLLNREPVEVGITVEITFRGGASDR